MIRKSFLFLQGPRTPFYKHLASTLRSANQFATQLQFTIGDAVYWSGNKLRFVGNIDQLVPYYKKLFANGEFTDLVLFGDCRPVHALAIPEARAAGLEVHVFEEGYIRPYWVTLERDGVNAYSQLPKDPDWFRAVGPTVPHQEFVEFAGSFRLRALHDVAYNLSNLGNYARFPNYRRHALHSPWTEYTSYLKRGFKLLKRQSADHQIIEQIQRETAPYFVLPLQLGNDFQIRHHSPFTDNRDVLKHVLGSFASHAPNDALLVIKNHPLDPGFNDYGQVVKEQSHALEISHRVTYLETGSLPDLLSSAAGCVTVNSTSGMEALSLGCPLVALGTAFYDIPGLTHQTGLDSFWNAPQSVDLDFYGLFRKTVLYTTQINGGFYTREGITLAVRNALLKLISNNTPLASFGIHPQSSTQRPLTTC